MNTKPSGTTIGAAALIVAIIASVFLARRLQPRIDVNGRITLEIAGRTVPVALQNININGLQVELTAETMEHMASQRTSDGSWPAVWLRFGETLKGHQLLPSGVGGELLSTRRLNQKQYVAVFKFVAQDLATRGDNPEVIATVWGVGYRFDP